jgi:hypothetical protein
MTSKPESMKKEVDALISKGGLLYYSMIDDAQGLPEKLEKQLKDKKIKLPNFKTEYDTWYSEAHAVIKQVLPDRLVDFVKQYKDEKRKEIDFLTYGIADYLLGLRTTRYGGSEVIADGSAAVGKMQIQNSILDYYQLLKENDIIDTPKWRFIQHLGDLRNLCDHNKDREPTKDDVIELVEGVEKVIKTVF